MTSSALPLARLRPPPLPIRGTQMARGSGDQSKELSVRLTDSSSSSTGGGGGGTGPLSGNHGNVSKPGCHRRHPPGSGGARAASLIIDSNFERTRQQFGSFLQTAVVEEGEGEGERPGVCEVRTHTIMIYKQKQLKVLNLAPTSLCSSEFPSVDCEQIPTASPFASLGCRRSAANYRRW